MSARPNPDQLLISRAELQEMLDALLALHGECAGYRIDAIHVFAPGLIEDTNWRISPPLDATGERLRSPCWLAIVREVRRLQKQYRLPWP